MRISPKLSRNRSPRWRFTLLDDKDAELRDLLKTMLETGVLPTCPHGRPIVVEGSRRELEQRFRRSP